VFFFSQRGNNPSKFGANGLGAGQEVVDLVYGEQKRFPTEKQQRAKKLLIFREVERVK